MQPSHRRNWRLLSACLAGLMVAAFAVPTAALAQKTEKQKPAKGKAGLFERAVEQYNQNDLSGSLETFQILGKKRPKDALVKSWIGFVLYGLMRYDEAIPVLQKSIELAEDQNVASADTLNTLGMVYLAQKKHDAAIASFSKSIAVLEEDAGGEGLPSNSSPYFNLGSTHLKKGELDQSLAAFKKAAQISDALLDAKIKAEPDTSGKVQADADAEVAEWRAQVAIAKREAAEAHNNVGYVYDRKKQAADAVGHYRRAVELQPSNALYVRNLGLAYSNSGDTTNSIATLDRAAKLNSKDYATRVTLAGEYLKQPDTAKAIAEFKAASAIKPSEFLPHYNLGVLYVQTGKYPDAIRSLSQAVRLQQDNASALNSLGWAYYKAGNLTKSAEMYQRAIQSAPTLQSAHANLGVVLDKLGKREQAIGSWQQALKLKTDDHATRGQLANAYLEEEQYAKSIAQYRILVKANPKDAGSYTNLGVALERNGSSSDEAMSAYKSAIQADPKFYVAYNNLGALYERRGKKALAIENYRKALVINPAFPAAKKNLARLKGK